MFKTLNNNKGVALILTLLIISLIVALTLQLNTSMRAEVHAAYNLRDGITLEYVAKSGFYGAMAVLKDDNRDYDCLLDDWESFKAYAVYATTLFEEGLSSDALIEDLNGKIQVNNLLDNQGNVDSGQEDLLKRFLNLAEFNLESEQVDDIVDAIIDWLDPDDNTTSFGGAEESYYQSLDNPYSCRNESMESIEELLLVKGITKELYEGTGGTPGIADFLTIYGNGEININTAPLYVLKALASNITDEDVENIDAFRKDQDNENALENTAWIQNFLGGTTFNVGLTAKSTYFEITSIGKKDRMEKKIMCIVERDPSGNLKVVSWKKS